MSKSKLFIHIGTHKTGSTLIQNILTENQLKLRKEGIIYLGQYMSFAKHLLYTKEIDKNFIDKTSVDLTRKIKTYIDEKNVRFIISNEKFCGDKLTGYDNANLVAEILHKITKNLDVDVYIIVYLRRQDNFFESLYTQRVHNGASYSFDEFYDMFDDSAFHWENLLKAYAEVFGKEKIIARRYDKAYLPEKNSLIQDFGSIVDSTFLKNYTNSEIQNPGFSRDTLEIARLTSPYLDKGDSKKLRVLLKAVNAKQPFEKYSFFDPEQRSQFLSRFDESNSIVASEYFNESSGRLFPPRTSGNNYEPYPGLTPESVAVNLSKAIALINSKVSSLEKEIEDLKISKSQILVRKIRRRFGAILSPFPRFKSKLKTFWQQFLE